MTLRFYNAKLQRYDNVQVSNLREDTIIDCAVQLYGDDFYLVIQHDDFSYSVNGDIICTLSF